MKDVEIICVNDGSTDNSLSILKEYASQDNRFIVIDKENGGQGVARNVAIEKASGEYIGFVDSDDWIDIDMFHDLYDSAKKYSSDVTMCEFKLYHPNSEEISAPNWAKIPFQNQFDNSTFHWSEIISKIFMTYTGPWNKIYKTNFVKNIDAKFPEHLNYEDIFFVFKCVLNAEKINYIRKPLYINRFLRFGSLTADKNRTQFDIFPIMQKLKHEAVKIDDFPLIKFRFYEYIIHKYVRHYTLVNKKYKKEFWSRIKSEFRLFDKESKKYIIRRNTKFTLAYIFGVYVFCTSKMANFMLRMIFKYIIVGKLKSNLKKILRVKQ